MPVYSRNQLSGTNLGGTLSVTATNDTGAQKIHQVQATSTAAIESVWMDVRNFEDNAAMFTLVLDMATATGQEITFYTAAKDASNNKARIFKGLPLTATDTIIWGYMPTATDSFTIEGHYNLIATG